MVSSTNQIADIKTVSDNTYLKLEKYFLGLIDNAMCTGTLAPSFVIKPLEVNVKDDCLIYVYAVETKTKKNRIANVTIFGSMRFKSEANLNYMGKILIRDYLELEGSLDTALSEYRIKNFKKISHRQRHMEDRNDTGSF